MRRIPTQSHVLSIAWTPDPPFLHWIPPGPPQTGAKPSLGFFLQLFSLQVQTKISYSSDAVPVPGPAECACNLGTTIPSLYSGILKLMRPGVPFHGQSPLQVRPLSPADMGRAATGFCNGVVQTTSLCYCCLTELRACTPSVSTKGTAVPARTKKKQPPASLQSI